MKAGLTIEDAKATTQSVEDEIVALVPQQYVASTRRVDPAMLLSCDVRDAVTWTGGRTIVLQSSPDLVKILATIQSAFDGRDGFSARLSSDSSGAPELELRSEEDGFWIVGPMKGGAELVTVSKSPCFALPAGVHASDKY